MNMRLRATRQSCTAHHASRGADNSAPYGGVSVVGSAIEGEELQASVSALGDADGLGTLYYQWRRSGEGVPGATTETYLLGEQDVGEFVDVVVQYTDGLGTTEHVISAAVGPVLGLSKILLESGGAMLLESGGYILLEAA